MLILAPRGISFHAVVVFGLGKNLLFKSILGRCEGQVDKRKKVLPRVQTMLLCKRNAIQKSFFPKSCSFSQKVKKNPRKTLLILEWSFCHFSYFILTIWQPKKMSKQDIFGRKGAVQCWFLVRFRWIFESQVRQIKPDSNLVIV